MVYPTRAFKGMSGPDPGKPRCRRMMGFIESMSFISVQDLDVTSAENPPLKSTTFLRIKRLCDIGLAVLLLPLVAIVCLGVLLLNPFLNPGPLFYVQDRIGLGEKRFRMIKLRTMTGSRDAARFATGETHRITRLGRVMREKRIDELPQVFNILLGQMSFIGPRPEQPAFYSEFAATIPHYRARQIIKPGISGLAQVEAGYADDFDSTRTKLRYDLHYIRNMSLGMDLYVVLRTFRVLVTGFGAR